jgi:adenylate kinase family enzyme
MAEIWLKYHEAPRNWKPHVVWISGASGIGKSKLAYEMAGEENTYTCMKTGRWFEGYDAHETVIIDDIRKDFMKFAEFLQLIDRYTFRVECKGGSRQFLAKKIIITSIYPPEMLWSTREDIYQLTRRIDEQITFQGAERKPKDYDLISDDETL